MTRPIGALLAVLALSACTSSPAPITTDAAAKACGTVPATTGLQSSNLHATLDVPQTVSVGSIEKASIVVRASQQAEGLVSGSPAGVLILKNGRWIAGSWRPVGGTGLGGTVAPGKPFRIPATLDVSLCGSQPMTQSPDPSRAGISPGDYTAVGLFLDDKSMVVTPPVTIHVTGR